jgi:uncharacterized OB-fold protein
MTALRRTLPIPTPDSERFWAGCAEQQLWMQKCGNCGEINWFPRGMCVNCSADELEWIELSGRGTIYSFSIVDRPPSTAFPPRYALALVDLVEGPRMMTHIVGVEFDSIRIGLDVRVQFDQHSESIWLPVFTAVTG